jgi:5'-phosphate synthase pdxT subunit
MGAAPKTVGILALQGAVELHSRVLESLGAEPVMVRGPAEFADVDGLVIPGGESTTISMLLERFELFDPIAERIAGGMPVLGTCAGMVLLANEVIDGRPDQRSFGAIDIRVRRNAFGRQVDSFETELDVAGFDGAFHGVFIRAPYVEGAGASVVRLAQVGDHPVYCRQGSVLVTAFHPELADDTRIHRQFLDLVEAAEPERSDLRTVGTEVAV